MSRFTPDQLAFAASKQRYMARDEAIEFLKALDIKYVRDYGGYYSQDQFTYRDDPTRAMERSMINLANLALKAVRSYALRPKLEIARRKGTGPDVLDVVCPVLVG
jgi:hypothetical protein